MSNRQLAHDQMAGKMIAATPAIQLSRLFAGVLHKAMFRESGLLLLGTPAEGKFVITAC